MGERLSSARRLVILGDPGGGKTTLLRWLATAYLLRRNPKQQEDFASLPDVETLPHEDWLPILVRCRELDAAELARSSLEDILRQTLRARLRSRRISPSRSSRSCGGVSWRGGRSSWSTGSTRS